jgi:hypothetical protein
MWTLSEALNRRPWSAVNVQMVTPGEVRVLGLQLLYELGDFKI